MLGFTCGEMGNLVKHENVSKFCDNDCQQNFILLFMSLATAAVLDTVVFWVKFTLSFWKTLYTKLERLSIPNLDLSEKIENSNIKQLSSKTNFSMFLRISCSKLGWHCVKVVGITKIVKQIKFKRAREELEAKSCFQVSSWTKYLRYTLVFMWNMDLWEKFNFYFSGVFWKYWKSFHFGEGGTER